MFLALVIGRNRRRQQGLTDMRITRVSIAALTAACIATAVGCSAEQNGDAHAADLSPTEPAREVARAAAPSPAVLPTPEAWDALQARVEAHVDSVDRALRRVPNLTRTEQAALRGDANAAQTARAQRLGVRAGDGYERLAEQGRLVRLADNTRFWTVRDLDYSVPYVTPDTEAMLAEMGERFQAKLDSLGLPQFRLVINSVLRTAENQRALRRWNPNAAAGVSSHEYGTTIDVAYRRFAPPAEGLPGLDARSAGAMEMPARTLYEVLMTEMATQRGTELQAALGRVIAEMRAEGKLMVMMERQQTVFHMTVARRFPDRQPVAAE
jgi:hypothetical protein